MAGRHRAEGLIGDHGTEFTVGNVIASQRVGAKAPPDDRLREAIQLLRNDRESCFVASAFARRRGFGGQERSSQ